MSSMQQILAGAIGLLILFWLGPGIKASLEKSRQAEEKHWGTVLALLAIVIAFVLFLLFTPVLEAFRR